MSVFKTCNRIRNDRRGVTALEYGLIAALIAGAIIAGVSTLGKDVSSTFSTLGTNMSTATKITTQK